MKNWRGSGGLSPMSSNLSALAPPFTAPRAFLCTNSTPGVVPLNGEGDAWDGPGFSSNWYSSSKHKVDPVLPPYANYSAFSGVNTSGEMNGQLFSWDLPVGVSSTDHVVSRLGCLGKETGAGPSHSSYSLLGGTSNGSLSNTRLPSFGGSSASIPGVGKPDKSFSDHHTGLVSSISDECDDRSDENVVKYPLKCALIDGNYQPDKGNLAPRHTAGTYYGNDMWSNEWGGPATKYPLESVSTDGSNWLEDRQLLPQCLAGTTNGGDASFVLTNKSSTSDGGDLDKLNADPWNDGWCGPAVTHSLKSAQVLGKESRNQAPLPVLSSDIWKHTALFTPLWEQSTWCSGSNPGYDISVMKSATVPATVLQADSSGIPVGQVNQGNANSEIGGNDEISADLMPFHTSTSCRLLDARSDLQFDATFPIIHPDAFGNLYLADDEGLPKEKFSSENSFDQMLQSGSGRRFSSLAGAASSRLACDSSSSNPWSFHHSDCRTDSQFSDRGQPRWDGFYSSDIPLKYDSLAPSQKNKTEIHEQENSVKDPGSVFKLPAISCTSNGEEKLDGTVDAGSSWSKEIQSAHGTDVTTATEPMLLVSSYYTGFSSHFPPSEKLNEGERTPSEMHTIGDPIAASDMGSRYLADVVAKASSVSIKETSDSSISAHAPQNLSKKEKSGSTPKVDLRAMVLTLHNLLELLYYYSSTGEYEITEEDRHLLEKVMVNLSLFSSKDVVLPTNSREILKNSIEEPTPSSEVTTQLRMGQLEDRLDGINGSVRSMSDSEESSLGMLSSEVDPHVAEDNKCTQILNEGNEQNTDEVKFGSETLSSGVKSHSVKDDNVIQAIKDILSQHYHDDSESDSQIHFFRNLWLEAEAELCSQNYKARFNHVKSKLDAFGEKDSSETASAVERPPRPTNSVNFIAEDNFSGTSLEQNKNMIDSPRGCNNAEVGEESDVMARFGILKDRSYDFGGAPPPLITAKDAEVDILAEKASISPRGPHSSILIGTACCGENIDDTVMTRFNILIQRDKSLNSKQENSARTEADEDISEEIACATARDFPEHNTIEAMTSTFSEHMENILPHIPESSVMSRWNILKHRDEVAGSIQNIVYRDMAEVEAREEPINGQRTRELGCLYPDIMHHYNTLSPSGCGGQGTDSVLERLKVLKMRDENQSSTENNCVIQESIDLEAAVRGDYLHALSERTVEGSLVDDAAKPDCVLGGVAESAVSPFLEGKASGGWLDGASFDWEHVSKEEVAGRTAEW